MKAPSTAHLTEHELHLVALSALSELTHEEEREWRDLTANRPDLLSLSAEWKCVAQEIHDAEFASSVPGIPEWVVDRLDRSRQEIAVRSRNPVTASWRRLILVGLPLAALVTLCFLFLNSLRKDLSSPETLALKDSPVSFPPGKIVWSAPGKATLQSRPVFIWKGNPGSTYDLRLETLSGQLLFLAEGVQSPLPLESMQAIGSLPAELPAGMYRLILRDSREGETSTRDFEVQTGASSPGNQDAPGQILDEMGKLSAQGRREDALMLLMRLPEDALTVEEFKAWKRKLE